MTKYFIAFQTKLVIFRSSLLEEAVDEAADLALGAGLAVQAEGAAAGVVDLARELGLDLLEQDLGQHEGHVTVAVLQPAQTHDGTWSEEIQE